MGWGFEVFGAAVPLFVLVTGLFGMCAIGMFSDMVSKTSDNRNGRNACAIEKGLRFHYFKRSFKHFYTKKTVGEEDW